MTYRCLILLLMIAGAASTVVAQQEGVRALYSPKESAFDVSIEPGEDREITVVKLSHDGVILPPLRQPAVAPHGRPELVVDVKSDGARLAIVTNWGEQTLKFRCYDLQAGQWVLRNEKLFFEFDSERSRTLCLVRLEPIDTVRVTLLKKGEDFSTPIFPGSVTATRVRGQVQAGDPSAVFQFNPDGSILRNGSPYQGDRTEIGPRIP